MWPTRQAVTWGDMRTGFGNVPSRTRRQVVAAEKGTSRVDSSWFRRTNALSGKSSKVASCTNGFAFFMVTPNEVC